MAKFLGTTGLQRLVQWVKDGYEFILYSKANGYYENNVSLTGLVTSYTSEPYVNTSSLAYLWVQVKRTDDGIIPEDELYDIVKVECSTSPYNFKALNDVSEFYKLGTKWKLSFGMVNGEGINDQGGITTNSSYSRSEYIDVTGIDAIILEPTNPTVGEHYYDITIHKPIWWSGTNWTDALGNNV